MNDRQMERIKLVQNIFPEGIPRLWCPLLTHYRDDKTIDFSPVPAPWKCIYKCQQGY